MSAKESLLIEIRTEELPPAQLWELADSFPDSLLTALQKEGFADSESVRAQHENGDNKKLATPRRLAAQLSNISAELSPQEIMRRGPQIAACKDNDGAPTKALIGFMQSVGATCENDLTTVTEKGKEHIAWRGKSAARKLSDELAIIVERVLLSLPAPRLMRWGANEFKFIRPIRGVLLLHGKQHINGKIMGISATKTTKGHPFMSEGDIEIVDVDSYIDTLKANKVIVDMDERLNFIADEMINIADKMVKSRSHEECVYEDITNEDLTIGDAPTDEFHANFGFFALGDKETVQKFLLSNVNEENLEKELSPLKYYASVPLTNELLREVCAMCEFPVVHKKILDEEFRNLPWQCITECMQKHQRFLPMIEAGCELHCYRDNVNHKRGSIWYESGEFELYLWEMSPLYFVVSDNVPSEPEDKESILHNYDAVLRARLNDVQFYYEEDQKIQQEIYVEKLKTIIFHKKLGSQYNRIERVCKIVDNLKKDLKDAHKTVHPRNRDMEHMDMTQPRVQAEIFLASLPTQMVGEYPSLQGVMSRAYFDMSETNMQIFSILYGMEKLVGLFGIGEKSTSSKDPHGLRREAMAYVNKNVFYYFPNPREVIAAVMQSFDGKINDVTEEVYELLLDRFRFLLSQQGQNLFSFNHPTVRDAVLSQKPDSFRTAHRQVRALGQFMSKPECAILAAANKRIKNILRKSQINYADLPSVNSNLFSEDAERELHGELSKVQKIVDEQLQSGNPNFPQILQDTATLAPAVDIFFDKVLVNADKGQIRLNRFALLAELRDLLNTVGDLSYLAK